MARIKNRKIGNYTKHIAIIENLIEARKTKREKNYSSFT